MARRALPAPISEEVQVSLRGRIYRWWGGDNFEFGDHQRLHYILVQGIKSPAPGSKHYHAAKQATIDLTRSRRVLINVKDRDMMMREIAEVLVPVEMGKPDNESWSDGPLDGSDVDRFDLGLRLIELGWAEYNGLEFEKVAAYQTAEELARQQKLGIWSE